MVETPELSRFAARLQRPETVGEASRMLVENYQLRDALHMLRDIHDPSTDPWRPEDRDRVLAWISALIGPPLNVYRGKPIDAGFDVG